MRYYTMKKGGTVRIFNGLSPIYEEVDVPAEIKRLLEEKRIFIQRMENMLKSCQSGYSRAFLANGLRYIVALYRAESPQPRGYRHD